VLQGFKRLAALLPWRQQQTLKRLWWARAISRGRFSADEREFDRLDEWVKAGDWVLDIGANIGQYAAKLSKIVGPTGRVLALEPIPATFELLSANMAALPLRNVTLLQLAASDASRVVGMGIPSFDTGLKNYYMAHVTEAAAELSVLGMSIDALRIPMRITLVKIDVEGHELAVLRGMRTTLQRDHPRLIVEGRSDAVASYLAALGYTFEETEGSPNRLFQHAEAQS